MVIRASGGVPLRNLSLGSTPEFPQLNEPAAPVLLRPQIFMNLGNESSQ
jgi:hypothetical protein